MWRPGITLSEKCAFRSLHFRSTVNVSQHSTSTCPRPPPSINFKTFFKIITRVRVGSATSSLCDLVAKYLLDVWRSPRVVRVGWRLHRCVFVESNGRLRRCVFGRCVFAKRSTQNEVKNEVRKTKFLGRRRGLDFTLFITFGCLPFH